jgi:hypothetical protein
MCSRILSAATVFSGMQAATFAGRKLHTHLGAPQILFSAARTAEGPTYDPLLRLWEARLRKEILQGRTRCNVSKMFGEVLLESEEAYSRPRYQQPQMIAERTQFARDWFAAATRPDEATSMDAAALQAEQQAFFAGVVGQNDALEPPCIRADFRVEESHVKALLERLASDIYLETSTREAANTIKHSGSKMREIAGALTIMLSRFESWDWSQSATLRGEYTRTKWRMYIDHELIERLFLDLVGVLWGTILSSVSGGFACPLGWDESQVKLSARGNGRLC